MAPNPFARRKATKAMRYLAMAKLALSLLPPARRAAKRVPAKPLLIGGAAAGVGAAAYFGRHKAGALLPSRGGGEAAPAPTAPPQPSNYDAPGPPANTATPIPAPDPQGEPPAQVDPAAEEAAAAAEAGAIGGEPSDYSGPAPDEPAGESFRPAGRGGRGRVRGRGAGRGRPRGERHGPGPRDAGGRDRAGRAGRRHLRTAAGRSGRRRGGDRDARRPRHGRGGAGGGNGGARRRHAGDAADQGRRRRRRVPDVVRGRGQAVATACGSASRSRSSATGASPRHDARRWQSGPHLRWSLEALHARDRLLRAPRHPHVPDDRGARALRDASRPPAVPSPGRGVRAPSSRHWARGRARPACACRRTRASTSCSTPRIRRSAPAPPATSSCRPRSSTPWAPGPRPCACCTSAGRRAGCPRPWTASRPGSRRSPTAPANGS